MRFSLTAQRAAAVALGAAVLAGPAVAQDDFLQGGITPEAVTRTLQAAGATVESAADGQGGFTFVAEEQEGSAYFAALTNCEINVCSDLVFVASVDGGPENLAFLNAYNASVSPGKAYWDGEAELVWIEHALSVGTGLPEADLGYALEVFFSAIEAYFELKAEASAN